jgi:hypothetical protein
MGGAHVRLSSRGAMLTTDSKCETTLMVLWQQIVTFFASGRVAALLLISVPVAA